MNLQNLFLRNKSETNNGNKNNNNHDNNNNSNIHAILDCTLIHSNLSSTNPVACIAT